ncbi:MAG: dihydroxyacetone kinase subunit DhaK [Acidobacteriaceae bacterium]|nr:dihydroxyacetone kinase subunit DhaK [Acidobacteriaceae bacterium]
MKKLINDPGEVVPEMLEGLLGIYPGAALLADHQVLLRRDAGEARERQVGIVSGGGSGHEPAHAGYVGAGMLSAAVAGEVFTSPNPAAVLAAIRAVAGAPGLLLIVKNYTGDRLNFGLAAEMARAEGFAVETVVVADDVALAGTEQYAGARGIAGTVLVHKVAGAAAAEGRGLGEVAAVARAASDAVATMGVSLSAGTAPAVGKPSYTLGEQEIELGLGIHGEPGIRRATLQSADEMADQLIEGILAARGWRGAGQRIALLVNNLGATTPMELAIVARRAWEQLAARGLVVERIYAGTFMTSLDAAGVSISILLVNDERLKLLDAPTSAPAWPRTVNERPAPLRSRILVCEPVEPVPSQDRPEAQTETRAQRAIEAACQALIDAEGRLTEMDRLVGDGDLGANLSRAARSIQQIIPMVAVGSAAELLRSVGIAAQSAMGGSSGPLYGVFLFRAAKRLKDGNEDDARNWARAALEGCKGIGEIGGASTGDRTMLDALDPFARELAARLEEGRSLADAIEAAVRAAEAGAAATAGMVARRGRSSYLGHRAMGQPDPGAVAAAIWLRALVPVLARP